MSRKPRLALALAGALALVSAGVAVTLADEGRWDPGILALLLVLVVGADLLELEYKRISLSGGLLGLVIAMALLGPAQAAALASFSNLVWIVRYRPRLPAALANVANFATFPLVGGVVIHAVGEALNVSAADLMFAVAVVAGFTAAHATNAFITVTAIRLVDGISMAERLKTVFVPLLPSEAAIALLASIVVYAEANLGQLALALLIALFFLYLYLLRALLVSEQR
ncbi:MAG TPA: hypothetical protein VHF89_06330, partial [Solirubrobacteraceae bacterium]|nr:hypothetical protein [Solirubrobacteraceae bacterium]